MKMRDFRPIIAAYASILHGRVRLRDAVQTC